MRAEIARQFVAFETVHGEIPSYRRRAPACACAAGGAAGAAGGPDRARIPGPPVGARPGRANKVDPPQTDRARQSASGRRSRVRLRRPSPRGGLCHQFGIFGLLAFRPGGAGGADFGAAFTALGPRPVVMCHPGYVDDELRGLDPAVDEQAGRTRIPEVGGIRPKSSRSRGSPCRSRRRPSNPPGLPSRGILPFEKRPLALHSPPIAREGAIAAHDTVAGNCDRDGIGARRPAPRHGRLWASRSAARFPHSWRSGRPGSPASACQTRCWNAVPRRSSGRSRPMAGASTKPTTRATSCSNSASPPIRLARGKRS